MSIRIVATGGTFDKHYDAVKGVLGFDKTHLPQVLAQARITLPVAVEELMLLDSLDMRDSDRARILQACSQADYVDQQVQNAVKQARKAISSLKQQLH